MNNFDLKKYLVENKVTKSSQLEEAKTMGQIGDEIEELEDIKIRYEKKGDYDRAAEIEDKIESLKSEFKNLIKEETGKTLSGTKITYPKEIQDILNSLINLGLKKYQLSVSKLQGVYMIELPMSITPVDQLSKILDIVPGNYGIGIYPGFSGLSIKTDIKTN